MGVESGSDATVGTVWRPQRIFNGFEDCITGLRCTGYRINWYGLLVYNFLDQGFRFAQGTFFFEHPVFFLDYADVFYLVCFNGYIHLKVILGNAVTSSKSTVRYRGQIDWSN